MASTDHAENTTPMMHDLKTDPEKAAQAKSDLGGEAERDPEDASGPIPGDATKLEDAGPSDGGAAAWLVVLGAWCCSFSSPGWINSTYFPSSQCLPRFPLRGIQQRRDGLTAMLFHQAWAASSSITRLDL
jgi:hypothetical protein